MKLINKKNEQESWFYREMFGDISGRRILGRLSVGMFLWLAAAGTMAVLAISTFDPSYGGLLHVKTATVTASITPPVASWDGATFYTSLGAPPMTDSLSVTIAAAPAAGISYAASTTNCAGAPPCPLPSGMVVTVKYNGNDLNLGTVATANGGTIVGTRFLSGAYAFAATLSISDSVPAGDYPIVVSFNAVACP